MEDYPVAQNDKGTMSVIVCAVFQALATLFAAARLFCRVRMLDRFYLDDWIIMLSVVCGWLSFAFTAIAVHWGEGLHMYDLTTYQQSQVLLWATAGFFPGILSFSLPKLAVCSLLVRMLNPSKRNRQFMYFQCFMLVANSVVCFGLLFGRCRPFRAVWDVSFPLSDAVCFSPWHAVNMAIFAAAFALASDAYLAIYPAIVVWNLQINLKKKIALSCALGVGSLSVFVAAYKCTRLSSMASADFSYDTSDLTIWTIVEGSVVTIASSIPLLRPLLDMVVGKNCMDDTVYYHNRGNTGAVSSTYELGTSGTKKKQNTTTTNILRSILGDNGGSQESILDQKASRGVDNVYVASAKGHSRTFGKAPGRGIVLTQDITVTYSAGDTSAGGTVAEQKRHEWV